MLFKPHLPPLQSVHNLSRQLWLWTWVYLTTHLHITSLHTTAPHHTTLFGDSLQLTISRAHRRPDPRTSPRISCLANVCFKLLLCQYIISSISLRFAPSSVQISHCHPWEYVNFLFQLAFLSSALIKTPFSINLLLHQYPKLCLHAPSNHLGTAHL